jgi:S1-C subfamily serine protease
MEVRMSSTTSSSFAALSDGVVQAVRKAEAFTVLVDARRHIPASGVAYAADLVLTADHAVEREENIRIVLPDGRTVSAALTGRDPSSDLALLRLAEPILIPAERAEGEGQVGQLAVTVARPSTEGAQAGLALISAAGGPVRTRSGGQLKRYFRLDATPYPGFSGGPLVDAQGRVLGVNTSGLSSSAFLAIPAGLAWEIAAALEQHGHIKRGFLGIRSQPVALSEALQGSLGREQSSGLLLVSVDEGSPAAQGGLMVGDILTGIDNHVISDPDDLLVALGDLGGKTAAVTFLRGGQPHTVSLKVGER